MTFDTSDTTETDLALTCRDCGGTFNFGSGEQKCFEERGLQRPKRCKSCRQINAARRLNDSQRYEP